MKRHLVVITLSGPILVANLHDLHRLGVDVTKAYAVHNDERVIEALAEYHHPHGEEPEAPTGPARMPKPEAAVTTSAISVALTGQSMTADAGSMEILKV